MRGDLEAYLLFLYLAVLLSSWSKPGRMAVMSMQLGLYLESAVQCSLVTIFENGNKVKQKDTR